MESDIKMDIIEESIPYLVKGRSLRTGQTVIGFPYVYTKVNDDGQVIYCNCILVPRADDGKHLDLNEDYAIGFKKDEFHVISGPMHKVVSITEQGKVVFDGDDSVMGTKDISNAVEKQFRAMPESSEYELLLKKAAIRIFLEGIRWAAENKITAKNFEKE